MDARSFVTIEVTVPPGAAEPTALVLESIARKHIEGAVVRLHIAVPAELAQRLDDRAMREALAPAHSVASITREIIQDRRPRLGAAAQGITPQAALQWYLESRDSLDEETRRRAQEWGEELIQSELARE